MSSHNYVDLDPEVFPKVHIFKRSLITSGVRAALKTTQFDMWKYEPNKVNRSGARYTFYVKFL